MSVTFSQTMLVIPYIYIYIYVYIGRSEEGEDYQIVDMRSVKDNLVSNISFVFQQTSSGQRRQNKIKIIKNKNKYKLIPAGLVKWFKLVLYVDSLELACGMKQFETKNEIVNVFMDL